MRRGSITHVGYHSMDDDAILTFLTSPPARPGILATTRKDGRPHVAPIWYVVDDDDNTIVFTTGADTVKGRTLARTGRAALCVDDDQPPFSFVTVEGTVTLSGDVEAVRSWATVIGGRYMGADRAEEYGTRNGVPGELLVRLTPERIISAFDVAE
jgi:PPOX class probable F420-dependent enzyme